MGILKSIFEKAKKDRKTIVLPESSDLRVLEAAEKSMEEGIADIVLVGNEAKIKEVAKDLNLSNAIFVDPEDNAKTDIYVDEMVELRKHRGMTKENAQELIKDPIYFATMMVKLGDADGMVAGALYSTSDVWRPTLQIIKTKPGISTASSCFLMEVPNCEYGEKGVLIFADCGLNPDPNAEQLAAIAISAAESAVTLVGMEPRVAMLSFSTKGSAKHDSITKVVEATRIAKEIKPDLLIDGELQGDAALDLVIGQQKSPGSEVAGKANVLVFPDLNSGNIAYKLTERLANAMALGPLSQGLARPVNDLSRGCSVMDIVNVIAITAIEA